MFTKKGYLHLIVFMICGGGGGVGGGSGSGGGVTHIIVTGLKT